jgi:hypothetical protein
MEYVTVLLQSILKLHRQETKQNKDVNAGDDKE